MAWFSGKVSLGNFADIAGAVNKISESVKNIEKNFDTALGFEDKSDVASNEGHNSGENTVESSSEEPESLRLSRPFDGKGGVESSSPNSVVEQSPPAEESKEEKVEVDVLPDPVEEINTSEETNAIAADPGEVEADPQTAPIELYEATVEQVDNSESSNHLKQKESSEIGYFGDSGSGEAKPISPADQSETNASVPEVLHNFVDLHERTEEQKPGGEEILDKVSPIQAEDPHRDSQTGSRIELHVSSPETSDEAQSAEEYSKSHLPSVQHSQKAPDMVPELVSHDGDGVATAVEVNKQASDYETNIKEHRVSSVSNSSDSGESLVELEKVKREMKMMETALQGAARQAQAKADEIAKLMNENEQLKAAIEDLKRKSNEAELESLREEYHQRVASLERKVYALTKEKDTLRREQSRKSDAAALLKEKDEIINQVMAEGEELSKKQAAQESQIRKLRAQIREFEEEKKGLMTKLQVEENKVESIKRDKGATEKLLQETIEKHQVELTTQKEYYTNALNAAKEAEALAEARANDEARSELESRLREAEEREAMLVRALEELRQTLSRQEQQAVFREDMLRRDIDDLQKRYQASERRCEELVTQVPESTRPLLRQIEAMQETTARRAEAWAAVERSLNSRLQEEEAKAAAAEERERSINERLSQTLSRINVLEAQISCLRTEQMQLTRSLEKERQRAAENRQEYLALKEEADTHEGRVNQLEEEIKELKRKHKQELQEALTHRELLQQEIEHEQAARLELERTACLQSSAVSEQSPSTKHKSAVENGNLTHRLSSASSLSSMEESHFLQASLDSSDSFSERSRNPGETTVMNNPYYMRSMMTPNAFEAALRQKEGELASYMSRLASMESIRDSLAEELVKMTAQCEKLRAEASMLPGIRAELEALRRRHSAALELMGERDEELEELRADIVDLKEMYREQVNLLVNKIQVVSSSIIAA
ncbi:hypothetical protein LguiA_028681 [Lonicera macranthoides]